MRSCGLDELCCRIESCVDAVHALFFDIALSSQVLCGLFSEGWEGYGLLGEAESP